MLLRCSIFLVCGFFHFTFFLFFILYFYLHFTFHSLFPPIFLLFFYLLSFFLLYFPRNLLFFYLSYCPYTLLHISSASVFRSWDFYPTDPTLSGGPLSTTDKLFCVVLPITNLRKISFRYFSLARESPALKDSHLSCSGFKSLLTIRLKWLVIFYSTKFHTDLFLANSRLISQTLIKRFLFMYICWLKRRANEGSLN